MIKSPAEHAEPTEPTTARPRTRGKGRMTLAIKDSVEIAFGRANKGGRYLAWLAAEHPAVFISLVSRCIPQAVAVDINIHALDLGQEMHKAAATLARLNDRALMIDVVAEPDSPDTPDDAIDILSPDTVPGAQIESGEI